MGQDAQGDRALSTFMIGAVILWTVTGIFSLPVAVVATK